MPDQDHKPRLSFPIDAEVYRRIKIAAAAEDTSIRDYVEQHFSQTLPEVPSTVWFSLPIDEELRRQVKSRAALEGRQMSEFIIEAIEEKLRKEA